MLNDFTSTNRKVDLSKNNYVETSKIVEIDDDQTARIGSRVDNSRSKTTKDLSSRKSKDRIETKRVEEKRSEAKRLEDRKTVRQSSVKSLTEKFIKNACKFISYYIVLPILYHLL